MSNPIFWENKKTYFKISSAEIFHPECQMVNFLLQCNMRTCKRGYQLGAVVQSVVSLTSSLRVISLTVLADSIYNILIFFAEKM